MPIERLENGCWPHAARLPLGGGWSGHCTAPGHEGETPSQHELREFCNLGHALGCLRLPEKRAWDSVRFAARTVSNGNNAPGGHIRVRYVCERGHRPAEDGVLEFLVAEARWEQLHPDPRVQRMAECFLASHVEKTRREAASAAS